MGNPKHLDWLLEGVEAWNARRERDNFRPELAGFDIIGAFINAEDSWESNGAPLCGANLSGANLSGVDLGAKFLRDDDLGDNSHVRFIWATTDLRNANLFEANLSGATLNDVNFTGADLRNTILIGSEILSSILDDANLRDSIMENCSLQYSRLQNTDVRGTDLSKTKGLDKRYYMQMLGNADTKLPSRLPLPDAWKAVAPAEQTGAPGLPNSPVGHQVDAGATGLSLGLQPNELDESTLDGLFQDLHGAVEDLKNFGNLDNQSPLLVKGVERFLLRLPTSLTELDQVRFGAGTQALSIQFSRERPVLEEVAPEKIGHLEAALMHANLIAANLPIWLEFKKDEAETEPVFEARQEDIEAILEHAAEALESDPEHFDPSLFERIREYLDDATMVSYLASKDLLLNIAHKTFSMAQELTSGVISEQRKQLVKNIATALNVQLGAILLDLAGLLPNQLRWLVEWLEYLPKLLGL